MASGTNIWRTLDPRFSNRFFIRSKIAAAESARRSKISASINAALSARIFDRSLLSILAVGEHYEIAVQILAALSGRPNEIVAALYLPLSERLRPYRFACVFGAINRHDEVQPVSLETLRGMGTEAAACALAACGEFDWRREKRQRPRACFALRELIEARRS